MNGNRGILPNERNSRDLLVQRLGVSRREAEVLWWVVHDKSNDEIGLLLGVSPATIKTHLQNLFQRLNRHSKLRLAVLSTLTIAESGESHAPPRTALVSFHP